MHANRRILHFLEFDIFKLVCFFCQRCEKQCGTVQGALHPENCCMSAWRTCHLLYMGLHPIKNIAIFWRTTSVWNNVLYTCIYVPQNPSTIVGWNVAFVCICHILSLDRYINHCKIWMHIFVFARQQEWWNVHRSISVSPWNTDLPERMLRKTGKLRCFQWKVLLNRCPTGCFGGTLTHKTKLFPMNLLKKSLQGSRNFEASKTVEHCNFVQSAVQEAAFFKGTSLWTNVFLQKWIHRFWMAFWFCWIIKYFLFEWCCFIFGWYLRPRFFCFTLLLHGACPSHPPNCYKVSL